MLDEGAFDIEGTDPVTRRGDDVVGATDKTDTAVLVALHDIAAQIIASVAVPAPLLIAGEPEKRRILAIHGKNSRLLRPELLARLADDDHAVAGHGEARRAGPYRMNQTMMVADDHAELGLAIMVAYGRAEMSVEPPCNLWIERLAGTADAKDLALDRLNGIGAGCHQQPKGGGRSREVGDPIFPDDRDAVRGREAAAVEQGRVTER